MARIIGEKFERNGAQGVADESWRHVRDKSGTDIDEEPEMSANRNRIQKFNEPSTKFILPRHIELLKRNYSVR